MGGMSTGETWTLGHRPALDGLRGIAVLLVVVSHLFTSGPVQALGPVGVVMFFTLSGFLITSLLLEERRHTGRVNLAAFYLRRARRLFPAMAACVAGVAAVGLVLGSPFIEWRLVVGVVAYVANFMAAEGVGTDSALAHAWSLAVEEQFYLVWPLAFAVVGRLPRRLLLGLLLAGAAGSVALRFVLWDGGEVLRLYYGTDTRADSLLIGCALAVALHRSKVQSARPMVVAVALAGIVACVSVDWVTFALVVPTLVAVLTAVVIFHATQAGAVPLLTDRRLVLLGRRSYGLYLWHWPVILGARLILDEPSALVLAMVALPLSWCATALSWRYVEQPFLAKRSERVDAEVVDLERAVSVAADTMGRRSRVLA